MQSPITGSKLVILSIGLSLGIFMNVLDSSIANVSIPYISGDLGVAPDQGTWVITSFTVSTAISLPITGWLAKQFGEVRVFLFSTLLFTIASVFCALAPNLTLLILFRVLQGAVAGPMIPLSQSLLLANYPDDKKSFATALWAVTAVVAPIAGPILGGWITYNYSWPWIFYINLPIGLLSCFVTAYLLQGRETQIIKSPVDKVGLFLLALGIGCLQILLDKGTDLDWFDSNIIIALGIVSAISLVFLIIWELNERYPIIDLSLFRHRNFLLGTIALSLGYMVFFGNVVIFPLWLQTQLGYTAMWAGLAVAPIGLLSLIFTPLIGKYQDRYDLRLLATVGFLVFAAVSFWNASFNTEVSFSYLVTPRFFQGLALSCFFVPLITIIISGLPPERVASALGISNFFRILGGSFGVSLSVALWDRREAYHQSYFTEVVYPFNTNLTQLLTQMEQLGAHANTHYEILNQLIINQAYMLATNDFFWLSGVIFVCLIGIIWCAKPPFGGPKKPQSMH